MTDFLEIDRMTPYEYRLRKKAAELMLVDEDYKIHKLAWAFARVNDRKKISKDKYEAVYKDFKRFYDYAKEEKKVLKPRDSKHDLRMQHILELKRKRKNGG